MNILVTCLILAGVSITLMVGGYWPAARLNATSSAERLALAVLVGLCLFIWNVSALGFVRPISGAGTWLCFWPVLLGLLDHKTRIAFWHDFSAVVFNRRGAVAFLGVALFFTALLWPLLSRPELVFYDGTSNHDAFFWISGAEFLRTHTYMVEPVKSALQPFTNGVGVFSGGWLPMWGRMSSEGLLALMAATTDTPAIQLYVAFTAALFIPWIAAVYLVVKTFLVNRLGITAILALCFTQPLFLFFQGNANLPNLLGALAGTLLVVATERSLRTPHDRLTWLVVVALALHGLLCSYPEMSPFILLPVVLLVFRAGFTSDGPTRLKVIWPVLVAALAGLALNPATTVRACSGFFRAFSAARVDEIWPKIFEPLSYSEYIASLASLSMNIGNDLGAIMAGLCSLLILIVGSVVLRHAQDRFGALCILTGGGVLLLYTLITHFSYGWQKSAQFSGVFVAALLPVAGIEILSRQSSSKSLLRFISKVALLGCGAFFLYVTARNCFESHKWSQRKYITTEWLDVRDYAREKLRNAPVLIDAPSFSASYFNGMWSLYALAGSHPLFTDRGTENGGYLHDYTRTERQAPKEIPQAFLVSSVWAASFDANSPRLIKGESIALLAATNRVHEMSGLAPKNGVPKFAAKQIGIEITPHRSSELVLQLSLSSGSESHPIEWVVTSTIDQTTVSQNKVSGANTWDFKIPLAPNKRNQIALNAANFATDTPTPFAVTRLEILDSDKP